MNITRTPIYSKDPFTAQQEKDFLRFIREHPSCLSGKTPCVPAHVRRVSDGAGMGKKPRLLAVPMTDEEHKYQHQHGEYACFIKYAKLEYNRNVTQDGVKAWFYNRAIGYRTKFLEGI